MSGLSELKQKQRATWALGEYDRIADGLTISTDQTLRVARVRPGERVLDLATGTGITAIAARERGAIVTAVDLTPQLFIALSINLTHILRLPGVSARAGEAILILMTMLIGSLVALLPNLAPIQLGVAFLALGLATWGVPTALQLRAFARGHYHRSSFAIWRFLLHQLATVPLMLAGLSLCGYFGGGLLWFAAAVILSLMVTLNNAWVLLVEILR